MDLSLFLLKICPVNGFTGFYKDFKTTDNFCAFMSFPFSSLYKNYSKPFYMQVKIVDEGLNEILCFVLHRTPEFVVVFLVIKSTLSALWWTNKTSNSYTEISNQFFT